MTGRNTKWRVVRFLKLVLLGLSLILLALLCVGAVRTFTLEVNAGLQLAQWEKTANISARISKQERAALLASFKGNVCKSVNSDVQRSRPARCSCGQEGRPGLKLCNLHAADVQFSVVFDRIVTEVRRKCTVAVNERQTDAQVHVWCCRDCSAVVGAPVFTQLITSLVVNDSPARPDESF
ncbi:hypothetical protein MHYP_G00076400 [Metynnis hypsauchen]